MVEVLDALFQKLEISPKIQPSNRHFGWEDHWHQEENKNGNNERSGRSNMSSRCQRERGNQSDVESDWEDDDYPDFSPYPVEFDYLARCLYQFGPQMSGYRLVDLNTGGWLQCLIYAICLENTDQRGINRLQIPMELMGKSMLEVSQILGIRLLLLGPDQEQIEVVDGVAHLEDETSRIPYAVLFHSYDDFWYPLIALDGRSFNLFYEDRDEFLQVLLENRNIDIQ